MKPNNDTRRLAKGATSSAVVLAVLVAGCMGQGSAGGGQDVEVRDFSDFAAFSLTRGPGLGFCPPLDVVYEAEIALDDGGAYVANVSFLTEGYPASENCLVSINGVELGNVYGSDGELVECVVLMELPEQVLTAGQADDLLAVFSEVSILNTEASICQQASVDPCLISTLTFDDFEVSNFQCTTPRLAAGQYDEIVAALEDLRQSNPGEAAPVAAG
jgi:hypothetical protein